MTRYRAFGLEIASELELLELLPGRSEAAPDLSIVVAASRPATISPSDRAEVAVETGEARVAFKGVANFTLRPEQKLIEIEPVQGAEGLVSLPLLGPILALWLHLNGELVLHASAIAWQGGAYAVIGDKGAGKSTTAAALLANGGRLVTDDLLRLRWSGDRVPLCEPAYAQVKLTAASAEVFAPKASRLLAAPHADFTKQRFHLSNFVDAATPLRLVCTLVRGERLAVTRLGAAEALRTCLDHVFVRRFGSQVLSPRLAAQQFTAAVRLVDALPVLRLSVPKGLAALDHSAAELVHLLESAV